MRTEEEIQYRYHPVAIEGEAQFLGFKNHEHLVLKIKHSGGNPLKYRNGWLMCLNCMRRYRFKKKNRIVPVYGATFEKKGNEFIITLPQPRPKKRGVCFSCGRVLNDKGEK
jgi:hypothetical protein